MLKYKEVKYFHVDYDDLEDFFKEVYNLQVRPEIVAMQTYSNDMSDIFNIKKGILNNWESRDLDLFKSTGYAPYALGTVLTDLCNRDLIPEGQYLINISW